jgi:hypothetical protein
MGGDAGQVHAASVMLDHDQHIEPAQKDGVDVEKVHRGDRLGLRGQELLPARGRAPRRGIEPASLRISQMVDGAILCPRTVSSPQIRRYPQVGLSRAISSTSRRTGTRPSWCPARIGPAAPDQLGVPAQQRARRDDQGQLAAARGRQPPDQGGQDRPVGPGQPG